MDARDKLAADCAVARNAYDKARNLPRTEGRVDGKLVHKTALELVRAWAEWDKAHK